MSNRLDLLKELAHNLELRKLEQELILKRITAEATRIKLKAGTSDDLRQNGQAQMMTNMQIAMTTQLIDEVDNAIIDEAAKTKMAEDAKKT